MTTNTPPIPIPPPAPCISEYMLDPAMAFLNHGSFGALPRRVQAEQLRIASIIEQDSVRFFVELIEPMLDEARQALSGFVGCDPEGFAFVPNASTGVATVIKSLRFAPGDEIIACTHEYNACVNSARYVAERTGARLVYVPLAFPLPRDAAAAADLITRTLTGAITPRTKLLLLSHITSPTGFIMPVERIIREFAALGIDTLLDSAHAPAFLDLNVRGILPPDGPAYVTGNFHKWLSAPKGSAFLYVREDRRHLIDPLTTSHGYNATRTDRSRFRLQFDFTGTGDLTASLATPSCLRVLPEIAGVATLANMRERHNALCLRARDHICAVLGIAPPVPNAMLGCMSTMVLPSLSPEAEARLAARPTRYADALQDRLLARWRIQIPVFRTPDIPGRLLRISVAPYNTFDQFDYLARAVKAELAEERSFAGA